jgi:hypothetical protein
MVLAGIIGAVAGATGGWLISRNISRYTGGVCPLLCNHRISIPYFAFIGIVIAMELIR